MIHAIVADTRRLRIFESVQRFGKSSTLGDSRSSFIRLSFAAFLGRARRPPEHEDRRTDP